MAETEATIVDREAPQFIEEGPTLPALLTEDFVKQFERGVEVYKRWVSVCYKLTRESHWLRRDKKYSLQGPGAEALMNPLGISFEKPHVYREDHKDEQGDFYVFWCEGYMESRTLGRRGWYIGCCDSRDQFFTARGTWNPKTGEGDVKKSAMTNWIVNGVTRIAGIRDPDPASLTAAGLNPEAIPVADYSGRRTPEQETALISEAQRKRLWAICKSHNVSEDAVKKHFALSSFNDVKRGDYDRICKWAEDSAKPESQEHPGDAPQTAQEGAKPSGRGEAPPADDIPLPTVDAWRKVYADLKTFQDFEAAERELKKLWSKYAGEEQTALKFVRDKRKVELQPPGQGALV